jgi:flagellar hook-length control protein FliK
VERSPADRELIQNRISEALAQRMVNQINRGQWSLHLELKPADLGHISVEMTMHNGRLEAVFESGSGVTRLLILDGLERLRQDLERNGMNVASLSLQNASTGSSGGKPTPGRSDRKLDVTHVDALDEESSLPAGVERKRDGRSLDLMV